MSNSLLTIDMITLKALEILENNLVVTRNVNRQYDDSFAVSGAKIGTTLRIRLPDRATVSDGPALQVQDVDQQYTTLTVSTQKQVAINFTTAEMTMKLDAYADLVLKPRISQLATAVDLDVMNAYQNVYSTIGTPGTTPSTSLVLLQGQQKLNEYAAMMSPRYATVNPAANAALVEGMKGLFNPTDIVSRQFKNGMMGMGVLGYDEINMSQNIRMHTTGTRTATANTLQVDGTIAVQGATSIAIKGDSGTATFLKGDVFTIADVYSVNPQSRESTGSLQQFVVTSDATASGGSWATVNISPPIYTASQALATVTSFPQNNAYITVVGAASTAYPQNLIYHRDAITFATADLIMPDGVDMKSRQVHNGISLRVIRDYDINNDRLPCRVDVLYGYSVIRPEMAVRMWG